MRHRHAISDAQWERIKDLLPGKPGDPGVTAKDNRPQQAGKDLLPRTQIAMCLRIRVTGPGI
jgi:transposase